MRSVRITSNCAEETVSAHTSMADLFSIGIGPSSSHTVGPMRAAAGFVAGLRSAYLLAETTHIQVRLRGSLGATGVGHGTPDAVLAGLRGWSPHDCDPDAVHGLWERARHLPTVSIDGHLVTIAHDDIVLDPFSPHPDHPNALEFKAINTDGAVVAVRSYLSVGGGFVVTPGEVPPAPAAVPYPYRTFDDLLTLCASRHLTVAEIVAANEWALGRDPEADAAQIWAAMQACIDAGRTRADGSLPGGLAVRRRAPGLARTLDGQPTHELTAVSRIQLAALAVNEENASGFRVVTAPTNGAAGILPAVVEHYLRTPGADRFGVMDMLLTATAIGSVVKAGASISGAEVGCQGEVGSACAMAAGALCAALGGTPAQVGKAAEMGLEHHLGLTCDPVGGLVQIPCIERNAIAAVTAVQAATLTLNEADQPHHVSLDTAVRTLRDVGADMHDKYKETSRGGLAVNVVEC
ncbi:L-serine dehydratase [Rhodococcus sp. 27YEA15]|uniref:L-serine ammonia-lyase n=1 Tax=Rhodococcus sp. 27YEA15 TaxID=3156259 RepID=UPI003C7BF4FD